MRRADRFEIDTVKDLWAFVNAYLEFIDDVYLANIEDETGETRLMFCVTMMTEEYPCFLYRFLSGIAPTNRVYQLSKDVCDVLSKANREATLLKTGQELSFVCRDGKAEILLSRVKGEAPVSIGTVDATVVEDNPYFDFSQYTREVAELGVFTNRNQTSVLHVLKTSRLVLDLPEVGLSNIKPAEVYRVIASFNSMYKTKFISLKDVTGKGIVSLRDDEETAPEDGAADPSAQNNTPGKSSEVTTETSQQQEKKMSQENEKVTTETGDDVNKTVATTANPDDSDEGRARRKKRTREQMLADSILEATTLLTQQGFTVTKDNEDRNPVDDFHAASVRLFNIPEEMRGASIATVLTSLTEVSKWLAEAASKAPLSEAEITARINQKVEEEVRRRILALAGVK